MKTIPALLAMLMSFAAGWGVSGWVYRDRVRRLNESQQMAWEIANSTSIMSDKSLTYALHYQKTLDVCLTRLKLKAVK